MEPRMVEAATARFHRCPEIEILLGDGHVLPFEVATFDRALQHVADPAAVLAELFRVLKPGGLLRMGEPDWDSTVVDCDLETTRAFNRFICAKIVRNATSAANSPAWREQRVRSGHRAHGSTGAPRLHRGRAGRAEQADARVPRHPGSPTTKPTQQV
ncbi:methyltransferase domain-containing protein [Lentzea sp. NPDC059081]|uniref:methyltransferase domain-containing protein n=1 Tax=Lentzea sp. NPDC059081 TaxID=3346719 RepID=UPI00367597A5